MPPCDALIVSGWTCFDSTNIVYAQPTFERLLQRELRPFLLDISRLKCISSMWPRCMGPRWAEEAQEWDAMRDRWVLTGANPPLQKLLRFLGLEPDFVRVCANCPNDGGDLDLGAARCSIHGPFRRVEWGPTAADAAIVGSPTEALCHPQLVEDTPVYTRSNLLGGLPEAALIRLEPPRGYWAPWQWAGLFSYLRELGLRRLFVQVEALPQPSPADLRCVAGLAARAVSAGGTLALIGPVAAAAPWFGPSGPLSGCFTASSVGEAVRRMAREG